MGVPFFYGRRVTTTDTDINTLGGNTQRFYVPDPLTTTIIAYAMGTLAGKPIGAPSPLNRLAIATRTSGGTPDDLLRYTHEFQVTNNASYGGDCAVYEANLTSPLLMAPSPGNGWYSLGLTSRLQVTINAMRQASGISGTNENFYYKNIGSTSIPTDPVGGAPSNEGHMDVWVIAVTNTAPSVPSAMTPAGSVATGDLTPNLEADFADAEETLPNGVAWDYVNQVGINVRRKSDGVSMWNTTYTANPVEQSNGRSSIEYAGTALVAGIDYEWQIRHSDRAGAWSSWSSWVTFNINPGGTVSAPTYPVGKIEYAPSNITATWTHATPLSTNAVEVRIKQGGSVVQTSPTITEVTASGGTISVTWTEAAFTSLTRGVPYTIEMRGRDSASAWSPWSPGTAFYLNATPNVPTGLTPGGGAPVSGLPLLSFIGTDPDDLPPADLLGQIEITRANLTTAVVYTTWNATAGRFEFQTTATELPSTQTFSWKARLFDGTTISNWSAPTTVVYGTGPTVTVTAPSAFGTVTVSNPTVTWTATGQVSRRVRVYDAEGVLVPGSDSGTTTTASQAYSIPSGLLRNEQTYSVVVDVTNAVPLIGSSAPRYFTLDYIDPVAVVNFTAYPRQVGTDSSASAIEMNWSPTTYPAGQFLSYDLYRRPLSALTEDPNDVETHIRKITSPLQTSFIDYHPRSGVEYQYELRQTIQVSLDQLESLPAYAQTGIRVDGVILASALQPDGLRMDYVYLEGNSGPSHDFKFDQRQRVPMGARRGRTLRGSFKAWDSSAKFAVLSDRFATADQRIADIREALENGKTFSFRDDRGRKRWVTITAYREQDRKGWYSVDISWREEHFIEGESA